MNKLLFTMALALPLASFAEMGHMHHAEMPATEAPQHMMMTTKMVMPTAEPMPDMHMEHAVPMPDMEMMMPTVTAEMTKSTQLFVQANHDMHMGMNIEFTGTTDIDFLRGMVPHHQGAVDMANIVLEHGTNGNTKHLAQRIINAQNREMRLMNMWLDRIETNHGTHIHENAPSTAEFQMQNMVMHKGMNIAFTGHADEDFVRGMIPHHQGAVEMAKTVLQHGKDPAVRRFAAEVIADQNREIGEMKRWLRRLNMRRAGLL